MNKMQGIVVAAVMLPICLASYTSYRKATSCYQCAYSPGKTEYETVTYKTKSKDHRGDTFYVTRSKQVAKDLPGGWTPCKGPFDEYDAKHYGIDTWDCYSNCYTRIDKNNNVFRGCYKEEYLVDPHVIGCSKQGDSGSIYCFCEGDNCNSDKVYPYDHYVEEDSYTAPARAPHAQDPYEYQ